MSKVKDCPNAARYKAHHAPKCNSGKGCPRCGAKWKAAQKEADAARREGSEYEALGVDNYRLEPTASDDRYQAHGAHDPEAKRQHRQEYSRAMGETLDMMRDPEGTPAKQQEKLGHYIGALAEDERRFMNRRLARSTAIWLAREELALRRFTQVARAELSGRVQASGLSVKQRPSSPLERVVNVLLSDLHLGAWLFAENGEPTRFGPEEESRRLGKIFGEVVDYKPRYRAQSHLNLLLDGDLIEGLLLHDLRDGAPLTEQTAAFWFYMSRAVAECAHAYPSVDVWFQPGNHGRNKLRHPGRATSSKWDGEETKLAIGLAAMCSNLKNVKFRGCWFDNRLAVSAVPLPGGAHLLETHGDTEVAFADPDAGAAQNADTLNAINASRRYGVEFAVATVGHWHKARAIPLASTTILFNGALIPPNGFARSATKRAGTLERCGQWIFESVPGYPVGDLRFLSVGPGEDRDASLNKVIPPFRYGG